MDPARDADAELGTEHLGVLEVQRALAEVEFRSRNRAKPMPSPVRMSRRPLSEPKVSIWAIIGESLIRKSLALMVPTVCRLPRGPLIAPLMVRLPPVTPFSTPSVRSNSPASSVTMSTPGLAPLELIVHRHGLAALEDAGDLGVDHLAALDGDHRVHVADRHAFRQDGFLDVREPTASGEGGFLFLLPGLRAGRFVLAFEKRAYVRLPARHA